ncbi:hypothetical protein [Spirillospora sp. NPDC029432]|uniref:hypothetical protein n=1 Tax=Spirillospora sp. NPDC029432 TaxID=3154599 RepID=UPI003455BC2C
MGLREELPLRFEFPFRLWSYQISHRMLVLRGQSQDELAEVVDIEFLDVLAIKVVSNYRRLLIREATGSGEIDDFADIPARHRLRYLRLSVSDGARDGFVVCAQVKLNRPMADT